MFSGFSLVRASLCILWASAVLSYGPIGTSLAGVTILLKPLAHPLNKISVEVGALALELAQEGLSCRIVDLQGLRSL